MPGPSNSRKFNGRSGFGIHENSEQCATSQFDRRRVQPRASPQKFANTYMQTSPRGRQKHRFGDAAPEALARPEREELRGGVGLRGGGPGSARVKSRSLNSERLILDCIDAHFFNQIFVAKLLTRCIRFASFCTLPITKLQKHIVKFVDICIHLQY